MLSLQVELFVRVLLDVMPIARRRNRLPPVFHLDEELGRFVSLVWRGDVELEEMRIYLIWLNTVLNQCCLSIHYDNVENGKSFTR